MNQQFVKCHSLEHHIRSVHIGIEDQAKCYRNALGLHKMEETKKTIFCLKDRPGEGHKELFV